MYNFIMKKQKMMRSVRIHLFRVKCSAKRAFIPFLLLITLMMFFYILCLSIGGISFFVSVLSKVAGFIGVKALSFIFTKMSSSKTLAFVIGCAFRAILATEATPYVSMVLPAEERASSPLPPIPSPGSTGSSWIEETYGGGAEASSSAPLQQQGASSHTNPNGSPEQFPILKMASPKLREMQELVSHLRYENEASSSAREMAGPSNAGPSNPGPISIPISTISQDLIWEKLVEKNFSLESSLRNRILGLKQSPFLLDKTVDQYWSDIKIELDEAPSQREYNRLIDFENRDLLIRELKHESLSLFNKTLTEYPALRENAPYNPEECLIDFLNEKEDFNENETSFTHLVDDPEEKEKRLLEFLNKVIQDFRRHGKNSAYIKEILDKRLPWEK